jgi:hypothetical protein
VSWLGPTADDMDYTDSIAFESSISEGRRSPLPLPLIVHAVTESKACTELWGILKQSEPSTTVAAKKEGCVRVRTGCKSGCVGEYSGTHRARLKH